MADVWGMMPFVQPRFATAATNAPAGSFNLNSTSAKTAWVFSAETADPITHVGCWFASATGTPPTYRISLQGLDSSGRPDGTVLGGGSPASVTFTPPSGSSWNSTLQDFALDNSYSPARGELFAVVLEYSSGTVDVLNFSRVAVSISTLNYSTASGVPYALTSSGSWTKNNAYPVAYYRTADRTYGNPILSADNRTLGTNGHRVALKFQMPANFPHFKIGGLLVAASFTAGGSYKIGLWDVGGNVQVSGSIDTDARGSASIACAMLQYFSGELSTLEPATTYYLGIERVDIQAIVQAVSVPAADRMSAYFPGTSAYLSTWDGSSWTDVTTTRPLIEPIFAELIDAGGGGGDAIYRRRPYTVGA